MKTTTTTNAARVFKPMTLVPYWSDAPHAADCNTCGRDIWIGDRCVISGPTIHCKACGPHILKYDDNGETQ